MHPAFITLMFRLTSVPALVFMGFTVVVLGFYGAGLVALGLFYALLTVCAVLVSYRLTIAPHLSASHDEKSFVATEMLPHITATEALAHPGVFVPMIQVDTRPLIQFTDSDVPANLPVVGYASYAEATETESEAEADATRARALEAQAHQSHVLLSTDALRYFMAAVPVGMEPAELMASVIVSAKQRFPSEDGWVVISESRMREVCILCLSPMTMTSSTEPYIPTVIPEGAGSLAEMIASGNLGAAFALIGHRPMFALADAVADFDALYRARQGQETVTSDLLQEVTTNLSTDTLRAVTKALTSALDGTYTDEAEAVKTAIMKAVRVVG
jgi:hypothetical protein